MRFDNGQPINGTFLDYLLPSMQDHPVEFASLLVETPHPDGPYGAKGMGEAALPPIAPAIGNAIANALAGVSVRDLPIRPDKLIAAFRAWKELADMKLYLTTINGHKQEVQASSKSDPFGISA